MQIYTGKYDNALQLCLRPDVSKFAIGKALLAYTYSCLRSNTKALELARAVASTLPGEETVISTLGCTFKTLHAEKDFSDLYENALKKIVLSDQCVMDLFRCYCRQNDPKKMQFVAQRMHKSSPDKVSYLFWSITCMLLQDLPPTMMILTEKTASKVLYDLRAKHQPAADEMALYAFTLVRQGKYAAALDALVQLRARPSGSVFTDEDHFAANPHLVKMSNLQFSIHKIDLLIRQWKLIEAVQEGMLVLQAHPDQWNVHKIIVDCILNPHNRKNNADSATAGAIATSAAPAAAAPVGVDRQTQFPRQDLSALLFELMDAEEEEDEDEGGGSNSLHSLSSAELQQLTSTVIQHCVYLRELQSAQPRLRGPYLAEMHLLRSWLGKLIKHSSSKAHSSSNKNSKIKVTALPAQLWPSSGSGGSDASLLFANILPQGKSSTEQQRLVTLVSLIQQYATLIVAYVTRFQSKQCCFSDIKPYLSALHSISTDPHMHPVSSNTATATVSASEVKAEGGDVAASSLLPPAPPTSADQPAHENYVLLVQKWAVEHREKSGVKLHAAMQTALPSNSAYKIKVNDSASSATATNASTTAAVDANTKTESALAVSGSVAAVEEDEEDDEGDETAGGTAGATGGTPGAGASAGKKAKKNKKKKKSATAKAASAAAATPAPTAASVANDKKLQQKGAVEEHNDVLLLLCSYCKFDQVAAFCDTLLNTKKSVDVLPISSSNSSGSNKVTAASAAEMSERVALYCQSRELFQHGVGGEKRNVQPGDELLLQNSSLHRAHFAQIVSSSVTSTSASCSVHNNYSMSNTAYVAAMQWCRCVMQGKEASPYSFAFKMDLLEPCRELALGEIASAAYSAMGVKHIQVIIMYKH